MSHVCNAIIQNVLIAKSGNWEFAEISSFKDGMNKLLSWAYIKYSTLKLK